MKVAVAAAMGASIDILRSARSRPARSASSRESKVKAATESAVRKCDRSPDQALETIAARGKLADRSSGDDGAPLPCFAE